MYPMTPLIQRLRECWFHQRPFMIVEVPGLPSFKVTRQMIWDYGGPRLHTSCELCQVMEWRSRLNRRFIFEVHKCKDAGHLGETKILCQRAGLPDWMSTLKCYDFTLGVDKNLPGLRGLTVWTGNSDLMVSPKADRGCIDFRQRLAPFQIDIAGVHKLKPYSEYDFVFVQCHRDSPVVPRDCGAKVLIYCHDHHKWSVERQKLLSAAPHAVLTPYPTIWRTYYKIHSSTEVVFTPFVSGKFFACPSTDYAGRSLDVLAIGAKNLKVYPERCAVYELIAGCRNPKWKALGTAHSNIPYRLGCSAVGGSCLLNRWSQLLASAKVVVFGQDRWGYLVRKYTEIPASGSLMVCPQIPDLDTLGLKPGIHYIPLPRPVTELPKLLNHILGNWKKYEQIARNGLEWHQKNSERWLFDRFRLDVERVCKEEKNA